MTDRQEWLGLLATSKPQTLAALWADTGLSPDYVLLRKSETGSVMVRGRAGSVGKAFNLGEMTVTRASLRLADGTVGHGWCQGRDRKQAETAALLDALMQGSDAARLEKAVLEPLRDARTERRRSRAEKATATKVDFFTMARGDD
jgi:alpha-D-ribose 1-methylphosphonate 5-triphosphate synthase subunit PhnG